MRNFSFVLNSFFSYIEQYMNLIAGQIMIKGKNDAKTVASLLLDFKESLNKKKGSLIDAQLFDFTLKNGDVIASSIHGVLHPIKKVKKEQRDWINLSPKKPWELHVCKTDLSITPDTPTLIIPIGYGVTDKKNKFLGTISTGIAIDKLKEKLAQAIQNKYYSFIVLDDDLDYMLYSGEEGKISKEDKKNLSGKLQYLKNKKNDFGTLNETFYIDGAEYLFYTKTTDYPFIAVIGINRGDIIDLKNLELKMLELEKTNKYDEMFLLALLYSFQSKIIGPIVNQKSHYTNFKIPKVFSEQINNLFLSLEQMEGFMEVKIQKEVAEEGSREREKFFQMVLHDLKSPSGIINNILSLVESKSVDTKEALKMIKSAITQIIHTVNSLQLVAKMKNKTLKINKTTVNLEEIIDDIFYAFKYETDIKNISLKKIIASDNPVIVADNVLITRILTNLISNSIKFTDEGEVTVTVKDVKNKQIIEVKDSGCGMEEEKIKRVLTETNIGNNYGSTGLGLPIVKKFVEMHDGDLEIESEFGKGTKIILKFDK
jgi:signal transduction histidine kinase